MKERENEITNERNKLIKEEKTI